MRFDTATLVIFEFEAPNTRSYVLEVWYGLENGVVQMAQNNTGVPTDQIYKELVL
jgi:hypothetical protein